MKRTRLGKVVGSLPSVSSLPWYIAPYGDRWAVYAPSDACTTLHDTEAEAEAERERQQAEWDAL